MIKPSGKSFGMNEVERKIKKNISELIEFFRIGNMPLDKFKLTDYQSEKKKKRKGVYVIYDSQYILYVGISKRNIGKRCHKHFQKIS